MFAVSILDRINYLRKFVPQRLFADVELPEIEIRYVNEMRRTSKQYEDVGFAISLLMPGRPLFRYGDVREKGLVIPIQSNNLNIVCTSIDKHAGRGRYYDIVSLGIIRKIKDKLPRDYVRLVEDELGVRADNIRCGRLEGVEPEDFYILTDRWKYYQWSWGTTKSHMYRVDKRIYRGFISKRIDDIKFVRHESIAYGRYSAAEYNRNYMELGGEKESLLNRLGYTGLELSISDVYKYVYAFDYRIKTGVYKISRLSFLSSNGLYVIESGEEPNYRKSFTGTKIFCMRDAERSYPVLIGYVIESTYALIGSRGTKHVIANEFISHITRFLKTYRLNKPGKFDGDLYRFLVFNQVLYNAVKHMTTNDLILSKIILQGCADFSNIFDASVAYHEIIDGSILNTVLESPTNLLPVIRQFLNAQEPGNSEFARARLIDIILNGPDRRDCNKEIFESDELRNRFFDLFEGDWLRRSIKTVLVHSLNHHLILRLSAFAGTTTSHFSESYHFGKDYVSVYENVSGGLGIIESFIQRLDSKALIEELLLRMGECLIGMPELLNYVSILEGKGIDDVINDLDIIVTPEERDEALKVRHAIMEHALSLARLVRTDNPERFTDNLVRQVVRARFRTETEIMRLAEPIDIFLRILRDINRYRSIKTLFIELVNRLIESSFAGEREYEKVLSRIGRDPKVWVESFSDTLSGVPNRISGEWNRMKWRERRNLEKMIERIISTLHASLSKLYLASCTSACGLCYVIQGSCSYGNTLVQPLILNYHLLKIYARYVLEKSGFLSESAASDPGRVVGTVTLGGRRHYVITDGS